MVKPHQLVEPDRRRTLLDIEFYSALGECGHHLRCYIVVPISRLSPTIPDFSYIGYMLMLAGSQSGWEAFGEAPDIYSKVLSDVSLRQIALWIKDCQNNHPACFSSPSGSKMNMPSRLLSIEWRGCDIPPLIRLESTQSSQTYVYTALSHCWSLTKPLKPTLSNQSTHATSISWELLSPALEDAIVLTPALDLSHIWIDSLCIIQDSYEDWESEIPRMGSIYNSAYVVFAAHGPELGFRKTSPSILHNPFRRKEKRWWIRKAKRLQEDAVYARMKIVHRNIFSPPGRKHPSFKDSWFGRGWCMQERVFAPRILHLGGYCEEIFFECNTHTLCECGRIGEEKEATGKKP